MTTVERVAVEPDVGSISQLGWRVCLMVEAISAERLQLSIGIGDGRGDRDPALRQAPSAQRAVVELLSDPLEPRRLHSHYPIIAQGSNGVV